MTKTLLPVWLILILVLATVPPTRAVTGEATPIQHVVIITQENHSFDNYFGTYPTANGTLLTNVTQKLPSVNGIPDHVCVRHGSGCVRLNLTTSSSPENPTEGQAVYEADYSGGSNFPDSSGVQSMVYFDYHSIPAYWDYAEEYGLGDNYFSAVLSQTTPNRLFFLCGDSPVSTNYGPPPSFPYNSSILEQLDGAGLTWGYYDFYNADSVPGAYPLNYLSGSDGRAVAYNMSSFYADLSTGKGLPSVAFVNSLNSALNEHPSEDPTKGEEWVVSVVDRVMESVYWNSTAIFVTYDEGGGFYDHVVPPKMFVVDHGFSAQLQGLGQRVPLLAISPYSKESYVSHTVLSHLSLLHFIEYNWRLAPLNELVNEANLPLDFFDFTQSPRAPVILTEAGPYAQASYPVPLQSVSGGASAVPGSNTALSTAFVYGTAAVLLVLGAFLIIRIRSRSLVRAD